MLSHQGKIVVSDDNRLVVTIPLAGFLKYRCSKHEGFDKTVHDLWKVSGGQVGALYFLAFILNELQDSLPKIEKSDFTEQLSKELARHGHLRGFSDDIEANIIDTTFDTHNLLDQNIIHVILKVNDSWYTILYHSNNGVWNGPFTAKLLYGTALLENDRAIVVPGKDTKRHYELAGGVWRSFGGHTLPLDKYEVSRRPEDRGAGKLYWDGKFTYDPVSGSRLFVYPTPPRKGQRT